ncbi:MAG: DUF359 domain-containing protein [Euryarchaeota archaeon]|nr:DUF359 domain-containing protein [Euryarchaeota archaeon]
MGITIVLPKSLRPLLKRTFGVLYSGSGQETVQKVSQDLGNPTKLISVGDVTTFHLLESNIIPDVLIVDDRTKREPASIQVVAGTKHKGFKELIVENPPGAISEDLIDAIGNGVSSNGRVRISVKGEEDLAALPAIIMAPVDSVVLYGQPDEGMVFVRITRSKKDEIRQLLRQIIERQEHIDKELLRKMWRKLDGY